MIQINDFTKKQFNILNNIKSSFIDLDIEKGDFIGEGQSGERRHFKDGWYTKGIDGKWKKDKNQENQSPQQEQENQSNSQQNQKEELKIPQNYQEKFDKIKDNITNIINSNEPKIDQLQKLINLGLTNEEALVAMINIPLSEILQYKKENNIKDEVSIKTQNTITNSISKINQPSAESRWGAYDGYLDMVLENESRGLIVYGRGGVGKTYTLLKKLKENINPETGEAYKKYNVELDNLPQEYDYAKITGKATPVGVFQSLYEHNGKLIIFDDCDSVLEDKDSLMMLKAVLDTSGDQVVTYSTSSKIKDSNGIEIPQKFRFKGRIIFISNMPTDKFNSNPHLAAVKTRNLTLDLSMTADETMDRIKNILPKMQIEDNNGNIINLSDQDKDEVYQFFEKYKNKTDLTNLNARTFGNIAKIKARYNKNSNSFGGLGWEEVALNLLTN